MVPILFKCLPINEVGFKNSPNYGFYMNVNFNLVINKNHKKKHIL